MNKYLSIEEQRAFWTDLFAVTIRYEQRRRAVTEACPDSGEGLHQDDARIPDHFTWIAQDPVSSALRLFPTAELESASGSPKS